MRDKLTTLPGWSFASLTTRPSIRNNWEAELELQMLGAQRHPQAAYICSPCRADSVEIMRNNIKAARFYMYYVHKQMAKRPIAPHAYLPLLLSDTIMQEREKALSFGLELLSIANALLVCGRILSEGMRGEIVTAAQLNLPVIVFSPKLHEEITETLKKTKISANILCDLTHEPLAMSAEEIISLYHI